MGTIDDIEPADEAFRGVLALLESRFHVGLKHYKLTTVRRRVERRMALSHFAQMLDLMMPEMDGYQFCTAQKQNPRWATIPVVLMTAGADIRAKATELGARGYLTKPFKDLSAILDAVGSTLAS